MEQFHEPALDPSRATFILAGDAFTGKSTFATQAKDHYILNFDDGLNFLRWRGKRIVTLEEAEAEIDALTLQAGQGQFPYKAVVIDTLDTMYECVMDGVLREENKQYMHRLGKQGWSMVTGRYRIMLDKIKNLPCTKWWLAHTKHEEIGGIQRAELSLTPGAKRITTQKADHLFYIAIASDAEGPSHMMRTQQSAYWTAGGRLTYLPASIPLDYKTFIKHVIQKKEKKKNERASATSTATV